MKISRIEALSDGIFAIVMTLLVLDLKVPAHDLAAGLRELLPELFSFVLSFMVIGIFWVSHHIQLSYFRRVDFTFIWRNMWFLFFVCLIPFSASLFGSHPLEQLSQIIYALNLILCGIVLYGSWRYSHRAKLIERSEISDLAIINSRYKMLLPPALYVLAILCTFLSTQFSLLFFALGPVLYILPVDSKLWQKIVKRLDRD